MKARIYALACRVLPYAYCASMGAMLGLLLLEVLRAAK